MVQPQIRLVLSERNEIISYKLKPPQPDVEEDGTSAVYFSSQLSL